MNIRSQLSRRLRKVRKTNRSAVTLHLAAALLVSFAWLPDSTWAEQSAEKHNPHLSKSSPDHQAVRSLRIGFRTPAQLFASDERSCSDRCFALSTGEVREYHNLQSSFSNRDFSLNLGQGGPVSLRFTGSRLKMQVEF